jgi:hypothetical protein
MKIKLENKFLLIVYAFFLGAVFVLISPVHAAELFVNSTSTNEELGLNQEWKAEVFINSNAENINAVEGKLLFPANLLEVKEISDGDSVINLWLEKPQLSADGQIDFSGITPNGFDVAQGLVFSVIFSAKQAGSGALAFSQTRVLLNDGAGTAATLATSSLSFIISSSSPAPALQTVKDIYPPEEFLPQVSHDPNIFNGQWFLVFATQDKGSGVAGYEVKETKNKNVKSGHWLKAESPYLLQDQQLGSYIYVRATDQAGNSRIETILPRIPIANNFNFKFIAIIVLAAVIILFLAICLIKISWKKKKK